MTLRPAADPELAIPRARASVRIATAARLLDCDDSTIRRLVRSGALDAHRLGKRGLRVYVDAIETYQRQHGAAIAAPAAPPRPPLTRAHHEAVAYLQKYGIG